MSGFSTEWLALREPYDHNARSETVIEALVRLLSEKTSIGIVDLACGTGATFRALSPKIKVRQDWRLVDNDLSLLARVPRTSSAEITVAAVPIDIGHDLEAALDGPIDLVTTSALLDLVSEDWLQRFVFEVAARRLPVYAALSYDGRIEFSPADDCDAAIIEAVNAHQRTDKGFGPALGPTAAQAAIEKFRRIDYAVEHAEANWVFGPQDQEIQLEMVSGWASAARKIGPIALSDVIGWLTRRRDHIAAGRSSICVGHIDLFASPTGRR